MNGTARDTRQQGLRRILPAVVRVTSRVVAFLVWTTLAGTAFAQTGERREVRNFPIKPEAVKNLQHWVAAGHDTWCRNAEFVAAATLRRVASDMDGEYELASSMLEKERDTRVRAIYTYHSLDGRVTYRITVRRFESRQRNANSFQEAIWVPERAEIVTTPSLD